MSRVYILQTAPSHGDDVEVDALDGDPRRVELADPAPDGGLPLDGAYVFSAGRAVLPDFVPKKMRWIDARGRPVPDFDDALILNVSSRARGLIETLEPGVHQYLPVTYQDKEGRTLDRRYFLIVCNRIDSVDRERTTMILWQGVIWLPARQLPPEDVPEGFDASVEPRLVFSLARIGRCHIWRDRHLRQGPFLSEALAAALVDSGMTGLRQGAGFDAV